MLKVNEEDILITREELAALCEALVGAQEFYRYYEQPIKKRQNLRKLKRCTRHALRILDGKIEYCFDEEDND